MSQDLNFEPLADRILVKPPDAEKITSTGIIIPDTAQRELPSLGEVVKIGPGRMDDNGVVHPVSVDVGDTIYFGRYAGYELEIDGVPMKVVRDIDVMGRTVD